MVAKRLFGKICTKRILGGVSEISFFCSSEVCKRAQEKKNKPRIRRTMTNTISQNIKVTSPFPSIKATTSRNGIPRAILIVEKRNKCLQKEDDERNRLRKFGQFQIPNQHGLIFPKNI